jgi:hypothetical protein
MQSRPVDPNRREVMKGGGRGYYRNISLLSAWAHAPFLHNNAIGPEICGKPKVEVFKNPADCWQYDPSVEGRYKLYKASMEQLLNPGKRGKKMLELDQDLVIDVAPEAQLGDRKIGFTIRIPKGYPAAAVNSLRFKDLFQDLFLVARERTWSQVILDPVRNLVGKARDRDELKKKYHDILSPEQLKELRQGLLKIHGHLKEQKGAVVVQLAAGNQDAVAESAGADIVKLRDDFIQRFYSNVLSWDENAGHAFGASLSEREKQALIAFVATL